MPNEPQEIELERLRLENEQLHQTNLELLLRLADANYETHRLWEFVVSAKCFSNMLIRKDYHNESKEWLTFLTGFDRLQQWTEQREQELNQKISVTKAELPPA